MGAAGCRRREVITRISQWLKQKRRNRKSARAAKIVCRAKGVALVVPAAAVVARVATAQAETVDAALAANAAAEIVVEARAPAATGAPMVRRKWIWRS
jgi:hypothetical protein